jgi:hypothetical protein
VLAKLTACARERGRQRKQLIEYPDTDAPSLCDKASLARN